MMIPSNRYRGIYLFLLLGFALAQTFSLGAKTPKSMSEVLVPRIAKSSGILSLSVSPGGLQFISGCEDKTAKIWSLDDKTFVTLTENSSPVTSVAFSPLGDTVVTKGDGDTAVLWAVDGKKLSTIHGHSGWVQEVAFAPDGKSFFTASDEGKVMQWDLKGRMLQSYIYHTDAITGLAISRDGKYLLTGSDDGTALLWEVGGKILQEVKGHYASVSAVAFSPDSQTFVTGGLDNEAVLWNLQGKELVRFEGHTSEVTGVEFSPDGKKIVTASNDKTARIWDLKGNALAVMKGHSENLTAVHYLSDGKLIITSSADGSHIFWNEKGKKLGYVVLTPRGKVIFTPDGRFQYDDVHSLDSVVYEDKITGQVISLDQFYDKFYTPNLYALLESGNVGTAGESITEIFQSSPAPSVALTTTGGADRKTHTVPLEITVCDQGGGIGDILLYHNDALLDLEKGERGVRIEQKNNCKIHSFNAPLVPGDNTYHAVAKSDKGMAAYTRNLNMSYNANLFGDSPTEKPALHLILVGIDKYQNPNLGLKYAVADAQAIRDEIQKKSEGLFSKIYTYEVYNKAATKEGIQDVFARAAKVAKPEDVAIIYMSGHGLSQNRTYYYIQEDNPANNEAAVENGISQHDLTHWISKVEATKKFVILDTCQSGGEWLVALRGMEEQAALGVFARTTGVWVIAASLQQQYAMESTKTGHGLLTSSILEGLNGKAGSNGIVSVGSLVPYVNRRVPEIAKDSFSREQYPYTAQHGQDFPIAETGEIDAKP